MTIGNNSGISRVFTDGVGKKISFNVFTRCKIFRKESCEKEKKNKRKIKEQNFFFCCCYLLFFVACINKLVEKLLLQK